MLNIWVSDGITNPSLEQLNSTTTDWFILCKKLHQSFFYPQYDPFMNFHTEPEFSPLMIQFA